MEKEAQCIYIFHYKGRKVASNEANSISKGRSCWRIAVRPPGCKKVRALDLFILWHLWMVLLVLSFNVKGLQVTQLN